MKFFQNKIINKNKGFSLIETLLIVGFIGIITAIIFVSYNKMLQKTKIENAEKYIYLLDGGMQSTWGTFLNTSDIGLLNGLNGTPFDSSTINNQNVLAYKIVPATWMGTGTNIINEWGGDVIVDFRPAIVAGQPNLYSISMNDVPEAACSYLASNMGVRFYEININGINLKNSLNNVANAGNQIDAGAVVMACNLSSNNVMFYNRIYPINNKVYSDAISCSFAGSC